MCCAVPSVPNIYINNRYFIYIITYLYNPSALLPLRFSAFLPSGRGRPGPVVRPFSAENQEWRISNVFGWHRAGTEVARPCLGPFGGPFGKPPTRVARPSTVLDGLGRPRTGPAASGAIEGLEGPHGGPLTRGKASCGLSWVSCGLLDGPRPAVGLQRSPARGATRGPHGGFRLYPITKLGR